MLGKAEARIKAAQRRVGQEELRRRRHGADVAHQRGGDAAIAIRGQHAQVPQRAVLEAGHGREPARLGVIDDHAPPALVRVQLRRRGRRKAGLEHARCRRPCRRAAHIEPHDRHGPAAAASARPLAAGKKMRREIPRMVASLACMPSELLREIVPCLRYADVQRWRQTCRQSHAVPYAPTLDALGTAYRQYRRRRIWRQWRALVAKQWLSRTQCHTCSCELDLPHVFEMRVRDEDVVPAVEYSIFFAFCQHCWQHACARWDGPATPPAQWTCRQTQDFVQLAEAPPPPHPMPLPAPQPTCAAAADVPR